MPLDSQLALMDACLTFIQCYKAAGGHLLYKFHALVHLTVSACTSGNPAYFSTYWDEHENGVVKTLAEGAHRLTWTRTVFEKLEVMEELLKQMRLRR